MKPSISTSPVAASCTMAGASPIIFSKSISTGITFSFRQNKKPAEVESAGRRYKCEKPIRRSPLTRSPRANGGGDGDGSTKSSCLRNYRRAGGSVNATFRTVPDLRSLTYHCTPARHVLLLCVSDRGPYVYQRSSEGQTLSRHRRRHRNWPRHVRALPATGRERLYLRTSRRSRRTDRQRTLRSYRRDVRGVRPRCP